MNKLAYLYTLIFKEPYYDYKAVSKSTKGTVYRGVFCSITLDQSF